MIFEIGPSERYAGPPGAQSRSTGEASQKAKAAEAGEDDRRPDRGSRRMTQGDATLQI
jgi:hypothetical protein